jgi:S1-C subfamily serine protease
MDSLNAQLRGLFRDSLGFSFRDGRGARPLPPRFGENVETGLRRMREEVGSLGLALATGRRAVAGAELTDITPGLSSYFGTDTGALVVRVAPESPAARAGLRDGDVILSVNGDEVEDVANLRWLLSRPDTRQFTLQVLRERSRVTIELGSGDV